MYMACHFNQINTYILKLSYYLNNILQKTNQRDVPVP